MRLIGITPTLTDKGNITIGQDYIDAVIRAGALPVLLPLTKNKTLMEEMLGHIDGLLLTGGDDVGPQMYGEEKLPCCGETAPRRDEMEFPLCRMALDRDMPILAICRGHQVLSCTLGGNMFQDIATQFSADLRHPRSDMPRDKVHKVLVEKGTLLHAITGQTELEVNSRHHQAVKMPGQGMTVCARATDGLIEAAELSGRKFVLGVQWHPESLSDRYPEAQALFNAFAEACGQ
ncbi:MAG: gamma-glutamyl-gamma-aminobutyrate hydrolase family protein [Clostridia bacterium]|nr:gamma-glutamyl-gamma-aminobutyrate hydrolase family protein [Clostridia bacterium]